MSPTARTLEVLRELGYTAQTVERWNPHAKIRQDLFGCIDVLAIGHGEVLGVQATSGTNHAAREAKSAEVPALVTWLDAGAKFQVWSWAKRGPRGKRKLWTLRRSDAAISHDRVLHWVPLHEAGVPVCAGAEGGEK